MDKFGIFKLISTFLDFYSKNKTDKNSPVNSSADSQNSQNTGSSNGLTDMISALLGGKNGGKNEQVSTPSPATKPVTDTPKIKAPLQSKMLAVMSSHDEFVKRVNDKNLARK